jgi:signal transduction histidine kinase
MNEPRTQFTVPQQEASLAHGEKRARQNVTAGVDPAVLEELIHDIRQPLGTIDSLAYFLELTSIDKQASTQLKRIRAMVVQANRILEQGAKAGRAPSATIQDLVRC